MKRISTQTMSLGLIPLTIAGLTGCKQHATDAGKFKGEMKLDVRQSTEDWIPYLPKQAPEGSPNILFILYDDTGLAFWSPFGGRANMPTLQMLANSGLIYSQFHTCALSSPTRSTLLTGRNHNLNGYASIAECASGFPGSNGRIPDECATVASVLRDNGYGTFWIGKNHNVPTQGISMAGDRKTWQRKILKSSRNWSRTGSMKRKRILCFRLTTGMHLNLPALIVPQDSLRVTNTFISPAIRLFLWQ